MKNIYFLVLFCTLIYGNDAELLSESKQKIILLKNNQIEQKEIVNKYNWLFDLSVNGSITKNQDDLESKDYFIELSQDLFRFGGIYFEVKHAKELAKLEKLNLLIDIKNDIYSLYSNIIDIKQNEINIKQNLLNIKNNKIDIEQKKSAYKTGLIGISDLSDSLIEKNNLQEIYKTLILQKQNSIDSLKKFTSKEHNLIVLPEIKLIEKDFFIKNSTSLKYALLNENVSKLSYKINKSSHYPVLTLNAKYGNLDNSADENYDYHKYGLSVKIPFSFTSYSDIKQKKLAYLISQEEKIDEINNESILYDETKRTIANSEEKIQLAHDDIKLFDELVNVSLDEYKAGSKTLDDVEVLKNTKEIRRLDIEMNMLSIKKQIIYINLQVL